MKVIWVILVMHYGLVNGLQMCKGPFSLPKIEKMEANPVYDYRNLMTEATFRLEVTSRYPLSLRWWTFKYSGEEGPKFRQSSEDSNDFRSTTKKSGDRYESKLHTKYDITTATNITELSRTIAVDMRVKFDCSSVTFSVEVPVLMQASRTNATFATITEMPRGRYYVSQGGQHPGQNTLRIGLTQGRGKPAPSARYQCRKNLERKDGQLSFVTTRYSPTDASWLNTTQEKLETLGITEKSCHLIDGTGLESYYVLSFLTVEFESSRLKDRNSDYLILFSVNIRRPGIKSIAILVSELYSRDNAITDESGLVLPTRRDTAHMSCIADAGDAPYIAAARWERGGNVKVLGGISYVSRPSMGSARFSVKSPAVGHSEDFVCSAASGQDVVSQRFTLYRHEPVSVKAEKESVEMVKGQNSSYNLSCEATGTPQPDIRFHRSSGFFVAPLHSMGMSNVSSFLENTRDDVITDSDLFKTEIRRGQGSTYAWITLKDVDRILEDLPENYWDKNFMFSIECVAYNRYTSDTKTLASANNPDPEFVLLSGDFN